MCILRNTLCDSAPTRAESFSHEFAFYTSPFINLSFFLASQSLYKSPPFFLLIFFPLTQLSGSSALFVLNASILKRGSATLAVTRGRVSAITGNRCIEFLFWRK